MNYLVEDLLKIHTPHHSQIQWLIMRYFSRLGYEARMEKEVWQNRKGRIDVFAQKGNYSVGIEVDDCSIRMNSIEKLNALKPFSVVFPGSDHRKFYNSVCVKQNRRCTGGGFVGLRAICSSLCSSF